MIAYSLGNWKDLTPLQVMDRLVHWMQYSKDFVVRVAKNQDGTIALNVLDVVDAFALSDFLQSPVQRANKEGE